MKRIALLLIAVAMAAGVVTAWARTSTSADAEPALQGAAEPTPQTARDVRGISPYTETKNEPPPRLFVDDPLPEGLAQGIVWIQWRVENLQVVPVFGKGAVGVSPRVGHLHVHVDDVGWWWADPSGINTVDIAGLSEGPHKVRLELVNANHEPFPGQSRTVTFTIPKGASLSLNHSHSR